MKRAILWIAVAACALSGAFASEPPEAGVLVREAARAAKKDGKNIWVIFHASWCGWCKRLDEFIGLPDFKQVFDDNFEIVHIVVKESADKKALENAGGDKLLTQWGGDKAGLPFFVMIDPQGKVLADSMMSVTGKEAKQNTGHPIAPEEIDHFLTMLKKAAPKMRPVQMQSIETHLRAQKPPQ